MSSPAQRYAAATRRHVSRPPSSAASPSAWTSRSTTSRCAACEAVEARPGRPRRRPDRRRARPSSASSPCTWRSATGRKAFYTTPIKALSNQKYADLVRRHGAENGRAAHRRQLGQRRGAGGRHDHRGAAQHALRRVAARLRGLGYVVMDEVHYLADRFRGAVWEEVIIHLPDDVAVVSLSATVSNAEEFGDWLGEVRGDTEVVVSEHRPVPLWQHMMVGQRLYDLFVDETRRRPAPATPPREGLRPGQPRAAGALRGFDRGTDRRRRWRTPAAPGRRGKERRGRASGRPPRAAPASAAGRAGPRSSSALDRDGLLPAITFIFSRAGCDAAVSQLLARDVRLITAGRGRRDPAPGRGAASAPSPTRTSACSATGSSSTGSSRGFAAHHAGMLPTFRRSSRSCSPRAGSGRSSPPRRWRWASTCPRAPSCSSGWSSGTARRTPTSPRPSTPSSPAGPAGAASTSRATPSCCGSAASTRTPSAGWRRRAPTRCARASDPPTTWPSTSCRRSAARPPARCSRPRSPSSRPTGPSSAGPAGPPQREGPRRATPRR